MAKKATKLDLTQFVFVDVHWEDPENMKRAPKWRRVKVDAVTEFQQQNSNYNVFATVQRFKNPVHTSPELAYMPLYFDLDSSKPIRQLLEERQIDIKKLEKDLTAEHIAMLRNYTDLGIEVEQTVLEEIEKLTKQQIWDANLAISQGDAVKLVNFFKNELGITETDVKVYFSGRKGFHVLVSPEALGVEPDKQLNLIYKFIALFLQQKLKLEALDVGSIYSNRRMLRLRDSIHQGSRLFKVEITHAELEKTPAQIRGLAKSPRGSLSDEAPQFCELASNWYEGTKEQWQEAELVKGQKVVVKEELIAQMTDYPVCMLDILNNGLKKTGDRNKATMALASFFKDAGTPQADAIKIITEWALKIPKEMTSANASNRIASTATAIKTIYSDNKYHFNCPFIRSLHGERRGKEYNAVACSGKTCPIHEDHQIGQEEAVKMHLSETAKADFTGRKVSFDCLVSGKLDTPYIVPKKINYVCGEEPYCEKECIMHDYSGFMEREFGDNERILIEATHQNDNNLKGILKQASGASCKKVVAEIAEYINVEELVVVPMAERVISSPNAETGITEELDEQGRAYVTRAVYYVGGSVTPNQYYEFEGYVYPHPKNQFGTVLSQKCTPKQDNVGAFKTTPEMIEGFKVFQVGMGETLLDRLEFILKDLTENVTLIWQREEILLGVLLTYQSALSFDFQSQRLKRGWVETILVGDSGMAKTQMVQNLAEFCGLGELASGESSSRTGLIYRLEQIGERWFITWGKYPLNDRRLLVIDELTGLSPDDLGKMTEPRSTGVLKVDRAVNAETNARTRLLLMTNPRNRQLFEYTHGIESLKYIFPEASDIRRLDLALFLATKDVPRDVLNRKYTKPEFQAISGQALKDSILWAWSRKPEDIEITPRALDVILKVASELGDKYGSAEDIPLVSPADQRIKVARLAVALASLVHSTDETHTKIVVNVEHVEFINDYLQAVYDNPNCRYNTYAKNAMDEGVLTKEERDIVDKELARLDREDSIPLSMDVLELFRRNDILKASELQDMTGQGRELVNPRLAVLAKYNFLKRTRSGFAKMPKFIEYLSS